MFDIVVIFKWIDVSRAIIHHQGKPPETTRGPLQNTQILTTIILLYLLSEIITINYL